MKHFFLFLFLLILFNNAISQNKDIPKPDFADQVMYFDTLNNSLVKLENVKPEYRAKAIALGYGGAKMLISLKGQKSPVRISSNKPQVFLIRLKDPDVDPNTFINFSTFNSSKIRREAEYMKIITFSGGAENVNEKQKIVIEKISDNICAITFKEPLKPGEYTFTYELSTTPINCFAFGID